MSMRPLAKNQEQPPALQKITPFLVPGMSCPTCSPCHAVTLPQSLGGAGHESEWLCLCNGLPVTVLLSTQVGKVGKVLG